MKTLFPQFHGRFYTYIRGLAVADFLTITASVFGMITTISTGDIYSSPFREYFVSNPVELGSYSYAVEFYRQIFIFF